MTSLAVLATALHTEAEHPLALLRLTEAQDIPPNQWTALAWGEALIDTANGWGPARPTRYTPGKPLVYQCSFGPLIVPCAWPGSVSLAVLVDGEPTAQCHRAIDGQDPEDRERRLPPAVEWLPFAALFLLETGRVRVGGAAHVPGAAAGRAGRGRPGVGGAVRRERPTLSP